jgi:hypothetical protein
VRKRSFILLFVLLVTLLFAMSTAVAAQPSDPGASKCALDITYDDYGDGVYWFGSISGPECHVAGAIRFDALDGVPEGEPNEYRDLGRTVHFVEVFTIWPGSADQTGDYIKGKNCGVWNLVNFNYRAHGWVTEVSNDQWSHLLGAQYHEEGTTGDPFAGLPIEAPDGTAKLVPGNRHVKSFEDLCAPPEPEE